MQRNKIILSVLFLTLPSLASSAGIKCWTNAEGIRECGNVVPPEFAQGGHQEISKKTGAIKKEVGRALTDEELKAEAEERQKQKELARQEAEHKRQDKILLDTFSNEDEIIMTRDGKFNIINTEITVTEKNIANSEKELANLRKSAAGYERKGKPIPENLQKDIQNTSNQIKKKQEFVTKKRQEQAGLQEEYDYKIKRYRELTRKDTQQVPASENTPAK
jgi:hypothetical protein